jgi:microcystin degradation protein MlrC
VGGKLDALHGPPLVARFTVVSLHEGRFEEPEARHGGASQFDMGPTAVLRTADGLLIMATSQRVFPVSLHQLTSCGIDPTQLRFIVAKGVNAPVTAYAQVCRELVRVDTIGSTSANMEHLAYADRRRPLFPFERDCEWSPHAYISARARPGA